MIGSLLLNIGLPSSLVASLSDATKMHECVHEIDSELHILAQKRQAGKPAQPYAISQVETMQLFLALATIYDDIKKHPRLATVLDGFGYADCSLLQFFRLAVPNQFDWKQLWPWKELEPFFDAWAATSHAKAVLLRSCILSLYNEHQDLGEQHGRCRSAFMRYCWLIAKFAPEAHIREMWKQLAGDLYRISPPSHMWFPRPIKAAAAAGAPATTLNASTAAPAVFAAAAAAPTAAALVRRAHE